MKLWQRANAAIARLTSITEFDSILLATGSPPERGDGIGAVAIAKLPEPLKS